MRRERRKLTKAELERITSPGLVIRKIRLKPKQLSKSEDRGRRA